MKYIVGIVVSDIIIVISLIPFIIMNYEITETCGGSTEFPYCETYKSINCSDICIKTAEEICEKRNMKFCIFNKDGYNKKTNEYDCKGNFSCDNKNDGSFVITFIIGNGFYVMLCLIFYANLYYGIVSNNVKFKFYVLKTLMLVIFIMTIMVTLFDEALKQYLYNLHIIFLMIIASFSLLLKIKNKRIMTIVTPFILDV